MRVRLHSILAAGLLLGPTAPSALPAAPSLLTSGAVFCAAQGPEAPAYYAVDLVTTRNLPGTGRAFGTGHVTFARSPFGVALAEDGSYLYDVRIQLSEMKAPPQGVLVAWVTTPQVDRIQRVGALDDQLSTTGQVTWNKFLAVVTLERKDEPDARTWTGPIVMRGMSRSGMMHTMAGHGPFQRELCAKYGYR